MKYPVFSWFVLLFLLLSSTLHADGGADGVRVVIEQVEDGDTVVARIDGKAERLQLIGIDAPEDTDNAKLQRDQKVTGLSAERLLVMGAQASQHLRSLLPVGTAVLLTGNLKQRDRYGRIPVVLHADGGGSINEAMVADGYAVVLGRYPLDAKLKARLQALESVAIAGNKGLWAAEYRHSTAAWSGKTFSP